MAPPDESGPDEEYDSDSISKKSKMLVRIVAGGFLLVGALNIAAYWLKARHDDTGISALRCVWLSIPLVIGIAILIKTSALASRLDEWLDE